MNRPPVNNRPAKPSTPCAARDRLLYDIQSLCFVKVETALYLDTHPNCKAALDYFYDVCDNIKEMTEKYEAEYGPLTHEGVQGDAWTWLDEPWPWQCGCMGKEG